MVLVRSGLSWLAAQRRAGWTLRETSTIMPNKRAEKDLRCWLCSRPRPLSLKTNPLVQIQLPYWELRNERWTCCDGQGALVFSTCPTCGWVVLICGEVGTVFEIRERHAGSRLGCIAAEEVCSQCGEKKYSDFCNATADEILSLGFQPADYR